MTFSISISGHGLASKKAEDAVIEAVREAVVEVEAQGGTVTGATGSFNASGAVDFSTGSAEESEESGE